MDKHRSSEMLLAAGEGEEKGLRIQEQGVVEVDIHRYMLLQAIRLLRRAPGPAEQAIDIGPKHREGMVQREKRIILQLLQLPLTGHAPPAPHVAMMDSPGKIPPH
jgi:hypothetical protein